MHVYGVHHVSAITAKARENVNFYTKTLGLRLVKKTVNQDDVSVYHLFYGDEIGRPGTELTFFEIPYAAPYQPGASSISQIGLRVAHDEALEYWKKRLDELGVRNEGIVTRACRQTLPFYDFEGQRLMLVSDEGLEGVGGGKPWERSPVPQEYGIRGLGPIRLTVRKPDQTIRVLKDVLGFWQVAKEETADGKELYFLEVGEGGNGARVVVEARDDLPFERPGSGSVHHVAFRVADEDELRRWIERINKRGYPNSGFVDRFYFKSLYFREPNGILFELATDGPGFATDEDFEHLGETLALPPFLEERREEIEARLKPLDIKNM